MIVSSFQTQYGLRLATELENMKWKEFVAMLSGLDHKTPLGRIVAIRAEDDPEVLKNFTKDQHRIRSEYRNKMARKVSKEQNMDFLESIKQAFISMAGGVSD